MFKLLDTPRKKKIYFMCCLCYIASGMMSLVFGAILPQLIDEAGFSYTLAGGLVSYMALGQVIGNFTLPNLINKLGIKKVSIAFTLLMPICLVIFTYLPPIGLMFLMVILLGCSRGTLTITISLVSNSLSGNSSSCINFINGCFALGAVLAPALISLCTTLGYGWRTPVYVISFLCFMAAVLFKFIDFDYVTSLSSSEPEKASSANAHVDKTQSANAHVDKAQSSNAHVGKSKRSGFGYILSSAFAFVMLANFFYVAIENSINGWFTSYLRDSGIMSANLSRYMVSLTWFMILIGRFVMSAVPESVSKKKLMLMDASVGFIGLMIILNSSSIGIILPALMLTGFCMAGMYPTALAYVGEKLEAMGANRAQGIAWFCALSTLGGMVGPQIIGMAADLMGMQSAMGIMGLYGGLWLLFTFSLYRRS